MEAEPLAGHDAEQVALMSEECILVDERDTVLGGASKVECHHGAGQLHRAFSLLIFDSRGRLQPASFPHLILISAQAHISWRPTALDFRTLFFPHLIFASGL